MQIRDIINHEVAVIILPKLFYTIPLRHLFDASSIWRTSRTLSALHTICFPNSEADNDAIAIMQPMNCLIDQLLNFAGVTFAAGPAHAGGRRQGDGGGRLGGVGRALPEGAGGPRPSRRAGANGLHLSIVHGKPRQQCKCAPP